MRLFAVLLALVIVPPAWADSFTKYRDWKTFETTIERQERADDINGLSYVLSGVVAVGSGFAGQGVATDPLEKGVYALFQAIGVAAIGYGAYTWSVGSEDRLLYAAMKETPYMPDEQRSRMLQAYAREKKIRERKERIVKAITHGMIAAIMTYTATQQDKGAVQNGLYFIGGINALAAIHYTF